MRLYSRLAPAGAVKIQKGGETKQTQINHMTLTATGTGTLTLADGTNTYVIDVAVGINEFCMPLIFEGNVDVTITAAAATISVFADYTHK